MATPAKLEPVDWRVGEAEAVPVPSTNSTDPTAAPAAAIIEGFRRRRPSRRPVSAKSSMDVVQGPRVAGVVEDHIGGSRLHDASRFVLGGQKEGTQVRDPLSLLHVVGDDN